MPKRTFIGIFTGKGPASGNGTVEGDALASGKLRCFQRIALKPQSTKATQVHFGLMSGSLKVYLGSAIPSVDNQVLYFDGEVWAMGDWRPFAEIEGPTSGHIYTLFTFGYVADDPTA
jgi:hypothetical protein